MLNNLQKWSTFGLQVLFFVALVASATLIANAEKQTNSDLAYAKSRVISSNPLKPTPATQVVAPAPYYGSVSSGIYITDPSPASYENMLQHKVSIMAWFTHWDEKIDNEKLAYACSHGYIPQITWESRTKGGLMATPYPLYTVAAGTYDQFVTSELESINTTCKKQSVIIRFNHEMDTEIGRVGWYPWQGNPDEYVAAWKRVVDISHKVSPNVKWLWSPNRGTKVTKRYYPGDAYVDYVGLTINRNPKQIAYNSFDVFYGHQQKVIESFDKPVMISETTYDQEGGDALSKAAWIASMATYIKSNPRIVSFAWFKERFGQSIESSPESIEAAKAAYAALEPRS